MYVFYKGNTERIVEFALQQKFDSHMDRLYITFYNASISLIRFMCYSNNNLSYIITNNDTNRIKYENLKQNNLKDKCILTMVFCFVTAIQDFNESKIGKNIDISFADDEIENWLKTGNIKYLSSFTSNKIGINHRLRILNPAYYKECYINKIYYSMYDKKFSYDYNTALFSVMINNKEEVLGIFNDNPHFKLIVGSNSLEDCISKISPYLFYTSELIENNLCTLFNVMNLNIGLFAVSYNYENKRNMQEIKEVVNVLRMNPSRVKKLIGGNKIIDIDKKMVTKIKQDIAKCVVMVKGGFPQLHLCVTMTKRGNISLIGYDIYNHNISTSKLCVSYRL